MLKKFVALCIFILLSLEINGQIASLSHPQSPDQLILISKQYLPPFRKGQAYQFVLHNHTFPTIPPFLGTRNATSENFRLCIATLPQLPSWLSFISKNLTLKSSQVPKDTPLLLLRLGFVSYFSKNKTNECPWPPTDASELLSAVFQFTEIPILDYPEPTLQSSMLDLLQSIPNSRVDKDLQHLFLPLSPLPLQIQLPSNIYLSNAPVNQRNLTYIIVDQNQLTLPSWMTWNAEQRIWKIDPVTQPRMLDLVLIVLDSNYKGGVHQAFKVSWGLLSFLPSLPLNINVTQPGVNIRINLTETFNVAMHLFDLELVGNSLFLKLENEVLQGIITTATQFQIKLTEKINPKIFAMIYVNLQVPNLLLDCSNCKNLTEVIHDSAFVWTLPSSFTSSSLKPIWYTIMPPMPWLQFDGRATFSGIPKVMGAQAFQIMVANENTFVAASVKLERKASRSVFLPTLFGILGTLLFFMLIAVLVYARPWRRTKRVSKSKGSVEVVSISHQVLFAHRGVPFQTMFRMAPGHVFAVCIQKASLIPSGEPRPQTYLSPTPLSRMSFPELPIQIIENPSHRGHSYVHVPHHVWLHMEYDVEKGLGFIKGMPKSSDVGIWEVRLYNVQALDQLLWNVVIRVI